MQLYFIISVCRKSETKLSFVGVFFPTRLTSRPWVQVSAYIPLGEMRVNANCKDSMDKATELINMITNQS